MFEDLPNSYDAIVAELPTVNGKPENRYQQIAVESEKYKQPEMQEGQVNTASNMNAFNQEIAKQEGKTEPFSQEWIKNETQATKTPAPDDYLSSIFGPPPQPKYDQSRQDRIKQIAKVNAIGEGLKSIGDIFSLAAGANVMARQPDQDARQMYVAWQNYEDMYANRMDEYNRQLWNQKLQNLYRMQDLDYRERRDKREDEKFDWQKDIQNKQFEESQRARLKQEGYTEDEIKLREKELNARTKQQGFANYIDTEQLKIAQQRANSDEEYKQSRIATSLKGNGKGLYNIYSEQLTEPIAKDLSQSEVDAIYNAIMADPVLKNDAQTYMMQLQGSFEGTNKDQRNIIAGRYATKSPAAMQLISTLPPAKRGQMFDKEVPDNPWTPRPAYNGPYRSGTTPSTTPAPKGKTNWDNYAVKE